MSTSAPTKDSNPFAALIDQPIHVVPSFTFESGVTLPSVPVAYKTWGKLNANKDNVLVICHALTGSADVEDWWGPLLGLDRAFDPTRWFIFCGNVIGSPYGTVSSVSQKSDGGKREIWGPEMPGSSPKDDVRLHYEVLKHLGVRSIAAVIGGSMGGMTCLEYPLNTPPGFVRHIVPLATSARHSAWCISWGEAERQSIYSDPDYKDGYYYEVAPPTDSANGSSSTTPTIDLHNQPTRGLAAARMAALLTYRSRDSFEARFGRRAGGPKKSVPKGGIRIMGGAETTDPNQPGEADKDWENNEASRQGERAWREHNDGHRPVGVRRGSGASGRSVASGEDANGEAGLAQEVGKSSKIGTGADKGQKVFSAQSYLRYQGDKFTARFDANCYIHLTRKMDAHDLSHPSSVTSCQPPSLSSQLPALPSPESASSPEADDAALQSALHHALSLLPPALVIGIESDGLFTTSEQRELAAHIPDSELVVIPSPDGHDGFLLEFEAINGWIEGWLRRKVPEYYGERVIAVEEYGKGEDGWGVKKESVFGEAEADVTAW